jgi:hypothetical protein
LHGEVEKGIGGVVDCRRFSVVTRSKNCLMPGLVFLRFQSDAA